MTTKTKERKHWAPDDKMKIVLEGITKEKDVSQLSDEYGINQTQYYAWRKQLLENARRIFTTKKEFTKDSTLLNGHEDMATVKRLRSELNRCKDVVVSLALENTQLRQKTM